MLSHRLNLMLKFGFKAMSQPQPRIYTIVHEHRHLGDTRDIPTTSIWVVYETDPNTPGMMQKEIAFTRSLPQAKHLIGLITH